MKQILAILLCISLFVQCTAHLAIVGLFKLNQDYIAKNLCENRDAPQKKCCGKCYLKKQLKRATDSEDGSSKAPTVKVEKSEFVCLIPKSVSFIPAALTKASPVHNPTLKSFKANVFPLSVFHPPAVSC